MFNVKFWVLTTLFLVSSVSAQAQNANLDQRVNSETTRDTGIYIIGPTQHNGADVLEKVYELPKGAKFSFRASVSLTRPQLKADSGNIVNSAGRYFGSLIIDTSSVSFLQRRRVEELNRQRIFIYEWHIDKETYLKQIFDIAPVDKAVYLNDNFEWDRISTKGLWTTEAARILQTQGREMLINPPSDVDEFCPNYQNLNLNGKTAFWIHLLNSIAKRESAFDPMVGNDESHFGSNNQGVISRGLLQISLSSVGSRHYRGNGCTARSAEDLHTVSGNLECGVAIFNHWVKTDDCISCKDKNGNNRGIARYWSTLRERYQVSCSVCSSGVANIGYREQIIAETSSTSTCSR